ncbi:MAG: zinc-binding dehydrogenase [Candidatus Rokubacteria bacterium]|nr:zinc-binding dehydrogenase [Candidatus Rokubacteria bacterium]
MIGHVTDPNAEAGLALRELPEPGASPADVVVDVRAYAINRGELHLLQLRPDGWTPGQDVAGVVVKAAADGSGPTPGTRVVAAADQGGWSERVAAPSHRVAAIPDNVSFADAAALPVAGLTALRALRTGGPLLGRRVLVTGASGGVGIFAIQLAAVAGAHVTALVSGPHRVELARALGAHEVLTSLGGVTARFDMVLDGVGGPVLVDALHVVAPDGTVAAYGMASGEKSPLAFTDFRGATNARLIGFFVYATDLTTFGVDLGFMAGLIGAGRLKVPGPRRDWKETRQALDLLRRREATGKVVLTIG